MPKELRLPDGSVVGTDVVEDVPQASTRVDQDSAAYRPVPAAARSARSARRSSARSAAGSARPRRARLEAGLARRTRMSPIRANFSTDRRPTPRMLQPAGGGVIGSGRRRSSGWPNPLPGPGVIVGGVTDALDRRARPGRQRRTIQVLADRGRPRSRSRTATGGLGVQKRGRTTRLRNGTVVHAGRRRRPSSPRTSAARPAGRSRSGCAGQPRLFRISVARERRHRASRSGCRATRARWSSRGRPGGSREPFPCVGLYFAGNGRWVAQQPNPNMFTVVGFAFDISNVMAQFNLETVCTCIVAQHPRRDLRPDAGDRVESRSSLLL